MSCVEPEMKFYNPTPHPHPTRSTQYAPAESRPTARAYFTAEPAADVGLRPGSCFDIGGPAYAALKSFKPQTND